MMFDLTNPSEWGQTFGLAETPLFVGSENSAPDQHRVLLDSGYGTFALSVGGATDHFLEHPNSWIWSADIPHHVAIGPDLVIVSRWDALDEPRTFSRKSVEHQLDKFYRYLTLDRIDKGRTVIDHLVSLFRRVRGAIVDNGADDNASVEAFLVVLGGLIRDGGANPEPDNEAKYYGLSNVAADAISSLPSNVLEATIGEYRRTSLGANFLDLYPSLAIRHAGGLIFQEAHFDLLRTSRP